MHATLALLAQATQPAPDGGGHWYDQLLFAVAGLLATAVTAFVIPALRKFSAKLAAETDAAKANAHRSRVEGQAALFASAKDFLFGNAARIAESGFQQLAERVEAGELRNPAAVKAHLHKWGAQLRSDAIEFFQNQGVDLPTSIGADNLDDLIEQAANATSPFPGKETAVAILKAGAARELLDRGTVYLRNKVAGTVPVAVVQTPAAAPADGPELTPPPDPA